MHELTLTPEAAEHRRSSHGIMPLFLNRWSPRSFTSETVREEDLMACFEAARWAPSSYNEQPWRFIFARKEADLVRFRSCLVEFNRLWADRAPVLVAVCASRRFTASGEDNRHFAFDTGAAWALLALEAARRGLSAHGMAGFDGERAKNTLNVPDGYDVMCFVALGHRGERNVLPEKMQRLEAPNRRKALNTMVYEASFPDE
jgi:nitroreductase